jgi:hypothetical protein
LTAAATGPGCKRPVPTSPRNVSSTWTSSVETDIDTTPLDRWQAPCATEFGGTSPLCGRPGCRGTMAKVSPCYAG